MKVIVGEVTWIVVVVIFVGEAGVGWHGVVVVGW